MSTLSIITILLGVVLTYLFSKYRWIRIYRPPEATDAIIERFGRFRRIVPDGHFTLLWPGERVRRTIPHTPRALEFRIDVPTRELIPLTLRFRITYRIDPERLAHASRRLLQLTPKIYDQLIERKARNTILDVVSHYSFTELFHAQSVFKREIGEALQEKVQHIGFVIGPSSVELLEIHPAHAIMRAAIQRETASWRAKALEQRLRVLQQIPAEDTTRAMTTVIMALSTLMRTRGNGASGSDEHV